MRSTKELLFISISLPMFFLALFLVFSGSGEIKIADIEKTNSLPIGPDETFNIGDNVITRERKEEDVSRRKIFEILEPFRPLLESSKLPSKRVPTMNDAEIFAKLFPDFYLKKLSKVQDDLVTWGWMQEQDKIVFSDEANVLKFLSQTTEIFISKGFYKKDVIPIVRNAVRIHYPNLLAEKKRTLTRTSLIRPFDVFHPSQVVGFEGALDSFASLVFPFLPQEAKAGINIPGIWETSPTCFKGINPSQTQKGVDLYSFCCNCGIKFYGYIPVYMSDCGPFAGDQGQSGICDVHLGCLNSDCSGNNNAIWDGVDEVANGEGSAVPQYTNKCGCDDPQHANTSQEGN